MNYPETTLDKDGYPTSEYLEWIKIWHPQEGISLLEFISIIGNNWYFGDWGFKLHRKYRDHRILELHTGGWSGNEEIIYTLENNFWFWMWWMKSHRGGHYYFEIPIEKKENEKEQ